MKTICIFSPVPQCGEDLKPFLPSIYGDKMYRKYNRNVS